MSPLHSSDVSGRATARTSDRTPILARSIMIIDDDGTSRLLLEQSLLSLGLCNPIIELVDGDRAFGELRRCALSDPHELPVLILLDRQMPGLNGLELLEWMRVTPGLEDVAVVMISGNDDADGVTRAYELGVRSYLVKPVGFSALAAVIRNLHMPWLLT